MALNPDQFRRSTPRVVDRIISGMGNVGEADYQQVIQHRLNQYRAARDSAAANPILAELNATRIKNDKESINKAIYKSTGSIHPWGGSGASRV
jgi:hypothetical protein